MCNILHAHSLLSNIIIRITEDYHTFPIFHDFHLGSEAVLQWGHLFHISISARNIIIGELYIREYMETSFLIITIIDTDAPHGHHSVSEDNPEPQIMMFLRTLMT